MSEKREGSLSELSEVALVHVTWITCHVDKHSSYLTWHCCEGPGDNMSSVAQMLF